jgi:SAM-dependent methyltransferase
MNLSEHQESFEQIYSAHPLLAAISKHQFDENGLAYKSTLHKNYWWWTFENIFTLLNLQEGNRLLNIGIGFGFDEKVIKSRLPSVSLYGIDIAPSMILGSLLNESPSDIAVATAEQLPFFDNTFERIVSREVIEHVFDPMRFLGEIKRVTVSQSRIVITTPNANSLALSHLLQKIHLSNLVYPQHHHKDDHMTTEALEKLFSASGFEVRERFFDCAGYFWLSSVFSTPLKPLALILAKFTRVLEGHDFLSKALCDQVKYVLVYSDKLSQSIKEENVWACPECKNKLVKQTNAYECLSCHTIYPLLQDKSPIFTTTNLEPTSISSGIVNRKPNAIIKLVILLIYSLLYGAVLLLGAGLALVLGLLGRSPKPGLVSK